MYDGIQRNVTLTDANDPELELLVEKQTSQDIGLEVVGEIAPGWNAIAYYAYTKARIAESSQLPVNSQVPNIASHNGGFWTTYEIQAGALQGLGFGVACGTLAIAQVILRIVLNYRVTGRQI